MSALLYDGPTLVVDSGMHQAAIKRVSADRQGRWAVSASDDKTVRVWSLADGQPVRTVRLPAGPDNNGKAYAVAMSPDGALLAVGGATGGSQEEGPQQVYLFETATGRMASRLIGLPSIVDHLVFSRDGERLAVLLYAGGLRVHAAQAGWAEVARDEDYAEQCYGAAFDADGRLATTCFDGRIRRYAAGLAGACRPQAVAQTPGGARPFGVAIGPDGRLAVGYVDSVNVDLFDGATLAPQGRPDLAGIDNGDLACVAWSDDGATLFAAGGFADRPDRYPVVAWGDAGRAPPRVVPARNNTVRCLVGLSDGGLLVGTSDPWLAVLAPDGSARWQHGPRSVDFRAQATALAVSADGARVDFDVGVDTRCRVRLDLAAHRLSPEPAPDAAMAPPRNRPELVEAWVDNAKRVGAFQGPRLDRFEQLRSMSVHPDDARLVIGTDWALRALDASGRTLWKRVTPAPAWAVNVSGDGRLVIAACGDGTIRWLRMTDGMELLGFMPLVDGVNWVAWTPEGFYDASAGAHGVLRWHVNRTWGAAADSVPISDIPGSYRPALPPLVLQELETARALGLAGLAEHRRLLMLRTDSRVPTGTRLHLLAVGIAAYNAAHAGGLRLRFAAGDARDLAGAIVTTQDGLYDVKLHLLVEEDATKLGVLRALADMRRAVPAGNGRDLVVVHFSGHGAMIDGRLYLLPWDVDATDDAGIKATALAVDELRAEFLKLAEEARVLLLLDACHAGAMTAGGAALALNATALRTSLAESNVTVLTSSSGDESSFEDEAWNHGAFTKVLLDAFDDPDADLDRNRLISTLGLTRYVSMRVPLLTGGSQNPGMELRFDGTLFASRQAA